MTKIQQQHENTNQQAARIILADPHKHGGPDSLAVRWARAVLERSETRTGK